MQYKPKLLVRSGDWNDDREPEIPNERAGVMGLWRVAAVLTLAAAVSACGSNAPTGPSTPTPAPGAAPPSGASATAPTISAQPEGQTIAAGQTATLTVAAGGTAPLSYQWFSGASGAISSPVNGATSASFTTPALVATTTYWVRVSNTAGAADSSAAEIKVTPAHRRRGRRAVDHRPAAASDDFGWTGRHVVRRSRRHGAADISVVFGDERSDGVAHRWRHFVQLYDAVVDGDREVLGPRHEQRRHCGLDDGDDHDLGATASFGH